MLYRLTLNGTVSVCQSKSVLQVLEYTFLCVVPGQRLSPLDVAPEPPVHYATYSFRRKAAISSWSQVVFFSAK